jgi:hypothetical protein
MLSLAADDWMRSGLSVRLAPTPNDGPRTIQCFDQSSASLKFGLVFHSQEPSSSLYLQINRKTSRSGKPNLPIFQP